MSTDRFWPNQDLQLFNLSGFRHAPAWRVLAISGTTPDC